MAQAPLTYISQLDCNSKSTGVVKWFSSEKGYGFISVDDGSDDVFVHQTEIHSRGYRTLKEGQKVAFEITQRKDGRKTARRVTAPNGGYVDDKKNKCDRNDNNNNTNNNSGNNVDEMKLSMGLESLNIGGVSGGINIDSSVDFENDYDFVKDDLAYITAVCIVPPEDIWSPIEKIREKHDKAYKRWPPHINILFPFVNEKHFDSQVDILTNAFKDFKKFDIYFNNFGYFRRNGNKRNPNPKQSVFLQPSGKDNDKTSNDITDKSLQEIYRRLTQLYPVCKTRNEFHGHLSVGQWTLDKVEDAIKEKSKDWESMHFVCDHICIVARTQDANSRMQIKAKIPLAT